MTPLLTIAEQYYRELGRPMLEERFPDLLPRIAAGLAGEGSECFGFDDGISRDHDYGPGFCLWLPDKDYEAYGAALQAAYDALPKAFMGLPPRQDSRLAAKRVGVFSVTGWFSAFIGTEQPPASERRWLALREERLATAVNGAVFEDGQGAFTALRNAIKYYPEPVRRHRLVSAASGMGQSGQYNYPRSLQRGDAAAAALARNEFVREALHMLYLMNRRYMPYYKWAFRGLAGAPCLNDALPLIEELALAPAQAKTCLPLIEEISARVIGALRQEGLTGSGSDFLVDHLDDLASHIRG